MRCSTALMRKARCSRAARAPSSARARRRTTVDEEGDGAAELQWAPSSDERAAGQSWRRPLQGAMQVARVARSPVRKASRATRFR
jgi:hypothetical protein